MCLCIFIKDPPYFNVRPGGEYRQEAGRELVIPCAASGDPDIPTITWRKVLWNNHHPYISNGRQILYCLFLSLPITQKLFDFPPLLDHAVVIFLSIKGGEAKQK